MQIKTEILVEIVEQCQFNEFQINLQGCINFMLTEFRQLFAQPLFIDKFYSAPEVECCPLSDSWKDQAHGTLGMTNRVYLVDITIPRT